MSAVGRTSGRGDAAASSAGSRSASTAAAMGEAESEGGKARTRAAGATNSSIEHGMRHATEPSATSVLLLASSTTTASTGSTACTRKNTHEARAEEEDMAGEGRRRSSPGDTGLGRAKRARRRGAYEAWPDEAGVRTRATSTRVASGSEERRAASEGAS